MFRKFVAVAVAATLVVGGLFAEEIKGVFSKFEDNTLTIKVPDKDGKEKTFKIDPDLKVNRKFGKDGEEKEFRQHYQDAWARRRQTPKSPWLPTTKVS